MRAIHVALRAKLWYNTTYAGMMELADVTDSKSVVGDNVWVRVPLPAPETEFVFSHGLFFDADKR